MGKNAVLQTEQKYVNKHVPIIKLDPIYQPVTNPIATSVDWVVTKTSEGKISLYQTDGSIHSYPVTLNDIYSDEQYGCIEGTIEIHKLALEQYTGTIQVFHAVSGIKLFDSLFVSEFYIPRLNLEEEYTIVCIPLESDLYQSKTVTLRPSVDMKLEKRVSIIDKSISGNKASINIKIRGYYEEELEFSISSTMTNNHTEISQNTYNVRFENVVPQTDYFVNVTGADGIQETFTFVL